MRHVWLKSNMLISVMIALLIAAGDVYWGLGSFTCGLYPFVIFVSGLSRNLATVLRFGVFTSLLVLVGYVAAPSGDHVWVDWVNRGLAVFSIWMSVMIIRALPSFFPLKATGEEGSLFRHYSAQVSLKNRIIILAAFGFSLLLLLSLNYSISVPRMWRQSETITDKVIPRVGAVYEMEIYLTRIGRDTLGYTEDFDPKRLDRIQQDKQQFEIFERQYEKHVEINTNEFLQLKQRFSDHLKLSSELVLVAEQGIDKLLEFVTAMEELETLLERQIDISEGSKSAETYKQNLFYMLQSYPGRMSHGLTGYLASREPQFMADIEYNRSAFNRVIAEIKALNLSLTEIVSLDEISNAFQLLEQKADEVIAIQIQKERLSFAFSQEHEAISAFLNQNIQAVEAQTIQNLRAEINRSLSGPTKTSFVFVVLALIISAFLSGHIVRSIINPLAKLEKGAEKMGKGCYDTRVPVVDIPEFKPLVIAFNQMADNILTSDGLLKTKSEQLERSNKDLQQFAFLASHDLKEPLRKIRAFLNLFVEDSKGNITAEQQQYIDIITDATDRMAQLINDLLNLSRVERETDEAGEHVMLKEVCEEAIAFVSKDVREIGGKVHIQGEFQQAFGSRVLLSQLFKNLLSNSIKYRSADRALVVEIRSRQEGEFSIIEIEDNGQGFDQNKAEFIFEPFRRLHSRSQVQGTGIGLALCRRIIEAHNGEIHGYGTAGKGARFVIALPCDTYEDKLRA